MDLRYNIHEQLIQHIATIRIIAKQETPAPLIWEEMQRYFDEAAAQLERNILPRVAAVTPHLDLLGGPPKVAEYVGATSQAAAVEDEKTEETPGFLPAPRNGSRA